MRYAWFAGALILALLAATGCGARKSVVSGLVTLDGKPLDNGSVEFFPVRGDTPTAAATIDKDGRYRLEAPPTEMKVLIHASKVVGKRKMYDDVPNSPTVDVMEEVVPAKYHDMKKSELTVTLEPGENTKDFALTSK